MKTLRYLVTGRVQGVGFRYFVWQHAEDLGVDGWVRNRIDGSVEALVRCTETQHLEIRRCLENGPRRSRVDLVDVIETEGPDPPPGFEIRRDGG